MSDKEVIKGVIDIDTKQADKNLNDLADSFDNLNNKSNDVGDSINKTGDKLDNLNKASKKGVGGLASIGNAFKSVGTALKSLGIITVIISAFEVLKDVFSSNATVVNAFETGMTAVKLVFTDFVNFLTNNTGSVVAFFKDVFENPLENIKKLGDLIKDNLIERFNSFLEVIQNSASAVVKFFKGDFSGAMDSLKEAGSEFVDVYTGVDNTIDKVGNVISDVKDKVIAYTKATIDKAKAMKAANDAAKISIATNNKLKELYERQAEQQRQIRDNDNLSINERIEANNKLRTILDEQSKLMLRNADIVLQQAQNEVALNATVENKVKLIEAQAAKAAILNQIEGQRSENIANEIALNKEAININNTKLQGDIDRAKTESENDINNEAITNKRLARLQLIKKSEDEIELDRLNKLKEHYLNVGLVEEQNLANKLSTYKEGTQAYVDAQNELLNKQQENAQKQIEIDTQIADAKDKIQITQKEKQKEFLNQSSDIAKQFSDVLGEQTVEGKALAVAATTIDTYQASISAFKNVMKYDATGGILAAAAAAAAALTGFKTIQKIVSVKIPNASGSGGGGGGSVGGSMPNVTPLPRFSNSQLQRLGQSNGDNSNTTEQKVIVTTKDITDGLRVQNEQKIINQL